MPLKAHTSIGTALAVLALASLGAQPAAAAEAPPPSLGPNEFISFQLGEVDPFDPTDEMQVDCNPEGTSTITFSVEGVSVGNYSGVFTESGVVTFGPAVDGNDDTVIAFTSEFRVDSPVGIVTGYKTLGTDVSFYPDPSRAFCGRQSGNPSLPTLIRNYFFASALLEYHAVIETETGTYTESGPAFFYLDGSTDEANPDYRTFDQFIESHGTRLGPIPPLPTSTEQCKKGGWETFVIFKNQGDCVSFVATGGKNPPANLP
jgi:hypothetical protein